MSLRFATYGAGRAYRYKTKRLAPAGEDVEDPTVVTVNPPDHVPYTIYHIPYSDGILNIGESVGDQSNRNLSSLEYTILSGCHTSLRGPGWCFRFFRAFATVYDTLV